MGTSTEIRPLMRLRSVLNGGVYNSVYSRFYKDSISGSTCYSIELILYTI